MKDDKPWAYFLVGVLLLLPFLTWTAYRAYRAVQFDVKCGGHIKRAADANSVEMATEEMETVIKYLDDHHMTSGYTTIWTVLWLPPDEDVDFWYRNLKSSLTELKKVTPHTRQEERAVLLLKLRQTLLDHKHGQGEAITAPTGISVFPNNQLVYFLGLLSAVLFVLGGSLLGHFLWQWV